MSALVDAREVAEELGVCLRTVRGLIARGELPALRIGRRVLVRREAVHEFITERERAGGRRVAMVQ